MRRIVTTALAAITLLGLAAPVEAQATDPAAAETVNWTVTADPMDTVKPGGRVTLTLHGEVADGWHVYALKQLPNGPTPLRVTLDQNTVATASGAPVGSPATKIHDQGFNLDDTQFYSLAFTVALPRCWWPRIPPRARSKFPSACASRPAMTASASRPRRCI